MPIPMKQVAAIFLAAIAITAHAQQIVVSKDNRTIAVTTSADANAPADTATTGPKSKLSRMLPNWQSMRGWPTLSE